MQALKTIHVGIISDGKYGERAFQNIKSRFEASWIEVPDIPENVMLDDDLELDIVDCDLYISYVRHPDLILQLVELNKPIILGVLPGQGLLEQAKKVNPHVVHAETMCSLESNTGIPVVDHFTQFFGCPIYKTHITADMVIERIIVERSSLCGSTEAGSKFLLNKKLNEKNLQEFALNICHECRAPRFGKTCDKEVAGIIHLNAFFQNLNHDLINGLDSETDLYIKNIKTEYIKRKNK